MRTPFFISALVFLAGCSTGQPETEKPRPAPAEPTVDVLTSDELVAKADGDFGAYWNRGLAEMNRFELTQQRYGEVHDGEFIMIFVTEPFLMDRQVKHEFGPGENAEKVMKVHTHRRFYTGLYPYNIHTSTFLPLGEEGAVKVAFTTTEWCGVAYAQLNKNDEGFRVRSHSYFQAEGDQDFQLPKTLLEDELWARLRKGPEGLPTGALSVVPGLTYVRLMHKALEPVTAEAKLIPAAQTDFAEKPLAAYEIAYPSLGRTLTIYFEESFPYRIHGFHDAHASLFGRGASQTTGRLTNAIMLDYWAKHGIEDSRYRSALGLDTF